MSPYTSAERAEIMRSAVEAKATSAALTAALGIVLGEAAVLRADSVRLRRRARSLRSGREAAS